MYFNVQFDVRAFWHGVLLNPHNAKVHHLTYDACLSSHSIILGIRSSSLRNLQCYPLTVWNSNLECDLFFLHCYIKKKKKKVIKSTYGLSIYLSRNGLNEDSSKPG